MFSSSNTANSKMPHRSLKTMESRRVVTGHRGFLCEGPHERRRELQDIPRTFEKAQFETQWEKDQLHHYRKKIVTLRSSPWKRLHIFHKREHERTESSV